jgi:hypothetical protein
MGFFICLVAQPTSATLNNQLGVNGQKELIAESGTNRARETIEACKCNTLASYPLGNNIKSY